MIHEIESDKLTNAIDKFNAFVIKTEVCWPWKGPVTSSGYGKFRINNKAETASRISWIIHKGTIPNGMFVLHTCDVRTCCNPDHLFLGTKKDNSRDMVKKGRCPISRENKKNPKISTQQVQEIIQRCFTNREQQNKVALDYGITPQAVRYIIQKAEAEYGKIWGCNKKTTEEDRRKIRELYEAGITQVAISKMFNIRTTTTTWIIHNKSYRTN